MLSVNTRPMLENKISNGCKEATVAGHEYSKKVNHLTLIKNEYKHVENCKLRPNIPQENRNKEVLLNSMASV